MTGQNEGIIKDRSELFTDGSMLLAQKALMDGAYDNGLFLRPDEAVGVALSAAMAFAIETAGPGDEEEAMRMVTQVFQTLTQEYSRQISAGMIRGKSRGGFRRRLNRQMAGFD